ILVAGHGRAPSVSGCAAQGLPVSATSRHPGAGHRGLYTEWRMATRFDPERQRWHVDFEQKGIRVFRRLPKWTTGAQAKALEVKLRREIFDRETLEKIPALTLQDAIDQWLREDHRREDRKKMASEAKQWAE